MPAVPRSEKRDLIAIEGVVSVGEAIRNGRRVLLIRVDAAPTTISPRVPDSIRGLPVVIERGERAAGEQTGEPQRSVVRPVHPGVSAGPALASGTLGFVMTDGVREYVTSNWHVFAANGNMSEGATVYQPSISDDEDDWAVATDTSFTAPTDGAEIDFARSRVLDGIATDPGVFGVGAVASTPTYPDLGTALLKMGRSSGLTSGTVAAVDVTADIEFNGKIVTFEGIIETTDMSIQGDSGSPTVVNDGPPYTPAGMVFAGNDDVTYHVPMTTVVGSTDLSIIGGGTAGDGDAYQGVEPFDPANVAVAECEPTPTALDPGESVDVWVYVQNDNDQDATWTAEISVDGTTLGQITGDTVAGGQGTAIANFTYSEIRAVAGDGEANIASEIVAASEFDPITP